MKIINYKKIWNDPVWSKIIANGLGFIISQIGIFFYGKINKINFFDVYKAIFKSLSEHYLISGWIILLVILLIGTSVFITIKYFKSIHSIKSNEVKAIIKPKELKKPEINKITEASTIFFHYRFCDAFPGYDNDYRWFTNQKEIQNRLKILLAYPTKFDKAEGHGITDPIWWFRGSSALFIDHFEILNKKKVLINIDELLIEKIAAYRSTSYYNDFVYVQCLSDKPTGLYKYDKKRIEEFYKEHGEYREEYGVFNDQLVSRREFDDGSALIKGKPTRIEGTKLRTRNLTKYNFIIAAKFSPFNCTEFYNNSEIKFIKLLNNELKFDDFIVWMKAFPKNHYDYYNG